MTEINYCSESPLTTTDFIDILERSGLAERRPMDEERISQMVKEADLTITAWAEGRLVGIVRSLTDYAYCCYCSDLAVDRAYQGRGIGHKLIELTREKLHPKARVLLLSAPGAVSYYEHLGFQRHSDCFYLINE